MCTVLLNVYGVTMDHSGLYWLYQLYVWDEIKQTILSKTGRNILEYSEKLNTVAILKVISYKIVKIFSPILWNLHYFLLIKCSLGCSRKCQVWATLLSHRLSYSICKLRILGLFARENKACSGGWKPLYITPNFRKGQSVWYSIFVSFLANLSWSKEPNLTRVEQIYCL